MRITILGAGSVGGYFGGKLAAGGADVRFVARGAQLDALRERGLRIDSTSGSVHVATVRVDADPAALGPSEVVFFAVKLYDAQAALALLPPLIGEGTVVIPLQNGVDSVDMLTRAVGREHVAGGTTYITASLEAPGVVRHAGLDRLIFGELDGQPSARLQALHDACQAAGFEATLSAEIELEIWTKFVHLSAFSGMTAVTRCPVGTLRDDPDLWAMWQGAIIESMAVARAKGIALPPTALKSIISNLEEWPAQAKSSLLQDLERGRRLELPWLSGAIVRLGRELGIDTPIHRFIAAVLAPHADGSPAVVTPARPTLLRAAAARDKRSTPTSPSS